MSLTLYQLADEYKSLLDRLFSDETGEIDEDVMQSLNALDRPMHEKCINTVRAMKSLEAEYHAIESERKAMQTREKALKSKIDWIKDYLLDNMQKSDINEISCPQFVVKLRKNPESTDLDFDFNAQDKYWRITRVPNLQAIKDDLKAGIDIPGARLVQTNSVVIK